MNSFSVFWLFFLTIIVICILFSVLLALLQRYDSLDKQNEKLAEMEQWYEVAFTDDLTGIQNRAAYSRHIAGLQDASGDTKGALGIVLFDIDDFKAINDTCGHLAGDKTLQSVATMLSEVFADGNYSVYRIGGDEFAVIAENSSEKEIIDLLLEVRMRESKDGAFKLSKGYAMVGREETFRDAFSKADEMLYADKVSRK